MAEKQTPSLLAVIKNAADEITGKSIGQDNHGARYANSAIVKSNLANEGIGNYIRLAQANSNLDSNISTPPSFYSPFLTVQSFQIPNNRKEVYLWANFFYDNDGKVAAAINFYTDFIFSGFTLECSSTYVKEYFEKLCKKLNFPEKLPEISKSYHLQGDAFVFASLNCAHCHGTDIDDDTGETCLHEGSTWETLSIMDPMQIEIAPGFIDKPTTYYYVPTDDMIRVVETGEPAEVFHSIPDMLKMMIAQRKPMPLNRKSIKHFKRGSAPWSPYGTSLVRSLFPTLAYKDKLRQAQYVIADRLILPVRVVKVGNDARPANEADIQNVQEQLAARANDPLLTIVTHHAITYEWFGANSAILQTSGEHDMIESDLLDGLMVSKLLLSGEGPQNSGNIGLLAMDRRLEKFRMEVALWMEEQIFKAEAEHNGFIMESSSGEHEIVYPKVKWKDLELRDQSNKLQTMTTLQQAGTLSAETLLEQLEINYDQEVERLRYEQSATFMAPQAPALGGGLPPLPAPGGLGGGFAAPGPSLAPAAGNMTDNYKFASNIIHNLVTSRAQFAPAKPAKFINAAHKGFYESLLPLTGRGFVGELDKKFNNFDPLMLKTASVNSYDPICSPLNIWAQIEYDENAPKEIKKIKTAQIQLEVADNTKVAAATTQPTPAPKLFTKLEQALYNIILKLGLNMPLYAQFQAGPHNEYRLDAAFPSIKLGIEADHETFHAAPEQIQRDKQRDMNLAGQGWVILRFTDKQIRDKEQEIGQVITDTARRLLAQYAGIQNNSNVI